MIWRREQKTIIFFLRLQSRNSYVAIDFLLHWPDYFCACRVVDIENRTLRKTLSSFLMKCCIWCIEGEWSLLVGDIDCSVFLKISGPTHSSRTLRCVFIISPTLFARSKCWRRKSFPCRGFLDIVSCIPENSVRFVSDKTDCFRIKFRHIRKLCH